MATTGILRASDVIFYHPLDDFAEHTIPQTWTGTGGFVTGKIGSATSAIAGDALAYGAISTPDSGSSIQEIEMVTLDSTRVLMAYKDSPTSFVRVGTVSGTTVTWGAAATGMSVTTNGFRIGLVMLTSTKFIFGHRTSSSQAVKVGTVSGTDVTVGAEHTFATATAGIARGVQIAKIDSTHALVADSDFNGAAEDGEIRVATVSGTSVTFGAINTFDTDLREASIAVENLDSTRVLMSWTVLTGSELNVAVVTISGTTATVGAINEISGALSANGSTHLALLTSTTVLLCFSAAESGNSPRCMVLTVSGTDVTAGPEKLVITNAFFGDVVALSSTKFAVSFGSVVFSNRATAYKVGTVSGTDITFGSASTPHTGTGSFDDFESMALAAPDSLTIVAAVMKLGDGSNDLDTVVGQVGASSSISAPTPGAYPTAIGHDRVAMAMWARNLTGGSSTVTIERGYSVAMTATSVTLGGTTATWSGAGIASLMSTMNDDSSHLLVLDFENAGGTNWTLSTSVDGAAFTSQGTQTSGTQAVTTADTAPSVDIANGAGNQWIDELVMWAGDKTAFDPFTTQELANLNDLANVFGETMNLFQENFGAPLCWQATARMPDGSVWRDSGNGPCPPVVRVPRGAEDVVVTDDGRPASPRIAEG